MTDRTKNILTLITAIPIGLGAGFGIQEIRIRKLRKKVAEAEEERKCLEKEEAIAKERLEEAKAQMPGLPDWMFDLSETERDG